jgi:hypothetical protein
VSSPVLRARAWLTFAAPAQPPTTTFPVPAAIAPPAATPTRRLLFSCAGGTGRGVRGPRNTLLVPATYAARSAFRT